MNLRSVVLSLLLMLCWSATDLSAHAAGPTAPAPVEITLLHTTDLHGAVLDEDGRPGGLARVAALIRRERERTPNTLLIDCGDVIQGNSQASLFRGQHIIDCMNALDYSVMCVGNHEFNFGQGVLALRKWQSAFPWVSANILARSPGRQQPFNPFAPYVIRTVGGVRVGVIGLTVTDIPFWEQPECIERLAFEDVVESARHWVREVRPLCDVLVIVAHTGVEPDSGWRGPGTDPGAAGADIARACPDVDVIVCGHRHVEAPSRVVNGVLLTEAGDHGKALGVVRLAVADGKVVSRSASLVSVTAETPQDETVLRVMRPYAARWPAWARRKVGVTAAAIDFRGSQTHETAAVDLIHRAMRRATGADITLHVAFNAQTQIPAGTVRNLDVFRMYEFDNALWVLTLTGRQVKEALEAGLAQQGTWRFLTAGGIHYVFDSRRPKGERLLRVSLRGTPLRDSARVTVAVNHYNAMGGGGMQALRGASSVRKTGLWMRDVIADYIRAQSPVHPVVDGWWRDEGVRKAAQPHLKATRPKASIARSTR